MKTVPVKTVRPGCTILHPETRLPLRIVDPKNVGISLLHSLLVGNNTVFAVDDEGGLYALAPDQQVEIPFNVPLMMLEALDNYIIVASFERQLSDDLPVFVRNFKEGRISAD